MFESIVSLLLILSPDVGTAAVHDAPQPVFKQTIVVTPERDAEQRADVAAAVSVIDREMIRATPASNASQLLEHVPGVVVYHSGGLSGRPVVLNRGFFGGGEVDYLALIVDGSRLGRPESGLAEWDAVPAAHLEKLEVVRGPLSPTYGDGAMGGAVQAFTTRTDGGGSASIAGGDFGQRLIGVEYAARTSVPLSLAVSGIETDGARENAASQMLSAHLGLTSADRVWSLRLTHIDSERADPGVLPVDAALARPKHSDPLFGSDVDQRRHTGAQASFDSPSLPLRASLRATRYAGETTRTILLVPGLGDTARRELDGTSWATSLDYEWTRSQRLLVRAGADAEISRIDNRYPDAGASASGHRRGAAAFATAYWDLSDRARLLAGVRYDNIADRFDREESDHEAWSPRVGVTYRLGSRRDAALYVQLSRAFKAPTLDQLFDVRPLPDFAGGTFTIANPSLEPQKATNVEAGISSSTGRMAFDAAAYWMHVDDEIDFDVATFRYQNISESIHRGLELGASWTMNAIQPRVTYAWTSVRPAGGDSARRQLKNIPVHSASAGAVLDLPAAARAGIFYVLAWERYLDDENRHELEPLQRLDVRLSRAFGRVEAVVDLLNVFNQRSVTYGYSLTGFDGSAVAYAYPGAPFSFRVGLNIDF